MILLPIELVHNSIEAYRYKYNTPSQAIYVITTIAVIVTIVSLPFIYINISVQGTGTIRPITERAELKSPVAEFVDTVYVKEGQQVKKGDVILKMKSTGDDAKINCPKKVRLLS